MKYKIEYFDCHKELINYLNKNKISPKSIISIFADNNSDKEIILIHYGYGK